MKKEPKKLTAIKSDVPLKRNAYKRRKGLPKTEDAERLPDVDVAQIKRKSEEYVHMTVTGSGGEQYRLTVPKGYATHVPQVFEWDRVKEIVANMLADGIPINQIVRDPAAGVKSRVTIYGWLEHPEFKEHVNGLVLGTEKALSTFRIAGLKRLHNAVENKLMREIENVELNDKTVHAFLSNYQSLLKMIAQEKGEFVEQVNAVVDQTTTLEGAVGVAHLDLPSVDQLLTSLPEEERRKKKEELDEIGNAIIRSLTS